MTSNQPLCPKDLPTSPVPRNSFLRSSGDTARNVCPQQPPITSIVFPRKQSSGTRSYPLPPTPDSWVSSSFFRHGTITFSRFGQAERRAHFAVENTSTKEEKRSWVEKREISSAIGTPCGLSFQRSFVLSLARQPKVSWKFAVYRVRLYRS